MKKIPLIAGLVTFAVLAGGIWFFSQNNSSSPQNPQNHEYFWAEGCIHCQNVAQFMETWEKKDLWAIEKVEVSQNQANARRLIDRGNFCRLPQTQMGTVPLLVTPEGKCYSGDTPIINYLKTL